jgi:hypothetical protein
MFNAPPVCYGGNAVTALPRLPLVFFLIVDLSLAAARKPSAI